MRELPEAITKVAFQAANGEYAWPRAHIVDALRAIAGIEQAILGGEVWVVRDGKIMGVIPSARDEPPAVWHWETSSRGTAESWGDYCERTADESIVAVTNMKVEDEARLDIRDHLFFNVTYVGQGEV